MSAASLAALALATVVVVLVSVRAWRGRLREPVALAVSAAILVVAAGSAWASYLLYKRYLGRLGRNLPQVELLAPAANAKITNEIVLRAHATDKPGALGPIAAVRRVEFWLYHPSFVEQHAGNHESKIFLGEVEGPARSDEYSLTWTCRNPLTPVRDGDHGGGDGTRTYTLPNDGRPYSVQAHGLDDEFFAHPKAPGKSQRVPIDFTPCASTEALGAPQASATSQSLAATQEALLRAHDWRTDWEVAKDFALSIDTEGFRYPTSIAFVPEPGPNPGDPLYFVTELRGAVKVVTNDRSVHTFADNFFRREPEAELPDYRGETGLVAVCLDAPTGYVFVSFARRDDAGVLRNAIVRFQSTPHTFSLAPTGKTTIADVLGSFGSARAHQVGPMLIHDGALYVGVGDALDASAGRDIDSLLGKVLRMTLDGLPLPDNPFAAGPSAARARDDKTTELLAREYVWASGLRNPFGLATAGGRVFATDNGPSVDRMVGVERGHDYAYDGSDWSMGTNALAVFAPSVGPVQFAWLPKDNALFPAEYRNAFYLAFGGSTNTKPGPGLRGEKSVVALGFDLSANRVSGGAQPVLRYRGSGKQMPIGLAFGPDGLYVAPLFDVRDGKSAILKLRYAPADAHPFTIERDSPVAMLTSLGCSGCHQAFEGVPTPAPRLDARGLVRRVRERIFSPEYEREVAKLDALSTSPPDRQARGEVVEAKGKEKVRLWLKYRILHPRFDSSTALMPDQEITPAQADKLADYFVTAGWPQPQAARDSGWVSHIKAALLPLRFRHVALAFVIGGLLGVLTGAVRRGRS